MNLTIVFTHRLCHVVSEETLGEELVCIRCYFVLYFIESMVVCENAVAELRVLSTSFHVFVL